MAKRNKIYYPEFEITNGLYTDGKEFMTTDMVEYIGYYHRYASGEIFTESKWNERLSRELIPFRLRNDVQIQYENTFKKFLSSRGEEVSIKREINRLRYLSPISHYPLPTKEDYENGFIERFFIKKRNDPRYPIIEVDKVQYDSLETDGVGISGYLFKGISLKWKISGNKSDIENVNTKILKNNEKSFHGITKYLSDLTEYAK